MDDDAADALADYVQREDCPCESLVMQVSDVDDFEGERFVRCLMKNRSITEIDLSDNLLGRAEVMRTVHQLKGTVDSLQSQLDSERMMRTNLEAKVSAIMTYMPEPGTLPMLSNSAVAASSNRS